MKLIAAFFLILFSSISLAAGFDLTDVLVICKESPECKWREQRFNNLVGHYRSIVHLKDTLKLVATDGGYKAFTYRLTENNQKYQLMINIELKSIIKEINIGFVDQSYMGDAYSLFPMKEGQFFEETKYRTALSVLKEKLEQSGYPRATINEKYKTIDDRIVIFLEIILNKPRLFVKVVPKTKSFFVEQFIKDKLIPLYKKPFEINVFKQAIDEAQRELFDYGYYVLNFEYDLNQKKDRVNLELNVLDDTLYTYRFKGIARENREDLLMLIKDLYRRYKRPLTESIIKSELISHYRTRAFLNVKVDVKPDTFKNRYNEQVEATEITVHETFKTRQSNISFVGNNYFSNKEIQDLYEEKAYELASLDFYDEEYVRYFVEVLKTEYIKNGFVRVDIKGPLTQFSPDKSKAQVEYIINENKRVYVQKLTFSGIPKMDEDDLISQLNNKPGMAFNPITFADDIRRVATYFQEKGYYFAEVTNSNNESLVVYEKNGESVNLNFAINPGPLVRLNRIIFLGNQRTKKRVLEKKVQFESGDIITPQKTRDLELAISSTGLFNTVNVNPVRHNSSDSTTDLVVRLSEREYGLVELAPGFRSDIGAKLAGTISYNNLGGLNRGISLRGQVNQRITYQTLDPRRRKEEKKLLEYQTAINYTQGDLFDTQIDLGLGAALQRKRFYSFDADIQRYSTTLTRQFSRNTSSSLRYQFERINQFDATEERDNGSFTIGAITPSFTWDLRNNPLNPTSGAFFNMSVEFANPYFLSQSNDDLIVNYYKLVSRNRFYIPFDLPRGVLAISLVGGLQQNLAREERTDSMGAPEVEDGQVLTKGYIPNIKVFRLTGMDQVRGFSDEEINRLPDGRDITEARVQDQAYMANLKIEPRFFINDSIMAGVFLDSGRVFVDSFDLGELRQAVGISFKILTPVGTLDFDYGIKLLRKKNADGTLESPGRFHVSIGFF
jgi:outer membrane protein insertion porin family